MPEGTYNIPLPKLNGSDTTGSSLIEAMPKINREAEQALELNLLHQKNKAQAFETTMLDGVFEDKDGNVLSTDNLLRNKTLGLDNGAYDDKLFAYSEERQGEKLGVFNKIDRMPGDDISGLYPVYNEELGKYVLKASEPGFPAIEEARKAGKDIVNLYGNPKYSANPLKSASKGIYRTAGTALPNLVNMSLALEELTHGVIPGISEDPEGRDKIDEWTKSFNSYWEETGTQMAQASQRESSNPYSAEGIAGTVGQGLGSVLEYMAFSNTAKGLIPSAISEKTALRISMGSSGMILNGGEAYSQALNAGLSQEDRARFAMVVGGVNSAIEMGFGSNALTKYLVLGRGAKEIPETILKETGGDMSKLVLDKATKNVFKKVSKAVTNATKIPVIGTGLEEGFEEMAQSMSMSTSEMIYDKVFSEETDKVGEGKFGTRFNKYTVKNALDEAFAGAITGMILGVPGAFSEDHNKNKTIANNSIVDKYISTGKEQFVKDQAKNLHQSGALNDDQYEDFNSRIDYLSSIRDSNKNLFYKYENSKDKDKWISSVIKTIDKNNKVLEAEDLKSLEQVDKDFVNQVLENESIGYLDEFKNQLDSKNLNKTSEYVDLISNTNKSISSLYDKGFDKLLKPVYIAAEIDKRISENKYLEAAARSSKSSLSLFSKIEKDNRIKGSDSVIELINLQTELSNKKYQVEKTVNKINNSKGYEKIVLEKTKSKLDDRIEELNNELLNYKRQSIPKIVKTSAEYSDYQLKKQTEESINHELLEAQSIEEVNLDPKNRVQLLIDSQGKAIDNAVESIKKSNDPQEVNDIKESVNNAVEKEEVYAEASTTTADAFADMVGQQEDKVTDKFDDLGGAMSGKYSGDHAHMLNNDIDKVLEKIKSKDFASEFSDDEQGQKEALALSLRFAIKRNRTLENFKGSIDRILPAGESKIVDKFRASILGVLNESASNKLLKQKSNKTEESISDKNNNSVGDVDPKEPETIRKDVQISSISVNSDGTYRYKLSNGKKGKNFAAVNEIPSIGVTAKDLNIDTEALDNAEVVVDDVVEFRVDRDKENTKGSLESNLMNKDSNNRIIQMVVNKNGKTIIIGQVPTNQTGLRAILDKEFESNSKNKDGYTYSSTTSIVSGAFYDFVRSKESKSVKEALSKDDQSMPESKDIGGWTVDYVTVKGGQHQLSGNTRMTVPVNDKFDKSKSGALIIPIKHPIMKGQYLYLRAFARTLKQYGDSTSKDAKTRRDAIVGTINKLFTEYVSSNETDRKSISDSIKDIIVRKFEVDGGNLLLKKRNGDVYLSIPLTEDVSTYSGSNGETLENWIDDSKLNIDKDKLNTVSQTHVTPYGNRKAPYNSIVSDYIYLTTETGNHINNVQILVKEVTDPIKAVRTKEVSKGVALENTVVTKASENADPGVESKPNTKKELVGNISPKVKPQSDKLGFSAIINKARAEKEGEEVEPVKIKTKPKAKANKKRGRLNISKDDINDIKNKANDPNRKTRFRRSYSRTLPKWNKEQELAWLKKNFPNVDSSVFENLQEVIANGNEYWGAFHKGAIYISENAGTGTAYHEAFHAMFWLYTTNSQRKALLDEGSKRYGIDRFNEEEIEEAIADDFMDYVQTEIQDNSWGTAIKNFFKNILQVIKSLHKHPIYSIDEMKFRGNNGFYANPKIRTGKFGSNVTRYRPASWTYRQEKDAVEAVNGYLLTKVIPAYRNIAEYSNLSNVEIINEITLDGLYLDVVDFMVELANDEEMPAEARENLSELVNELYDDDTEQFKELKTSLIRALDYNNGIKVNFETNKAKLVGEFDSEDSNEDESKEAEDNAQDKLEGWQNSATERSTKDNALQVVKTFLRYMDSGQNNIFGFPALVDYNETYDTLLKNLAGSTSVGDIVEYLTHHSETTNPEYTQILDEFDSSPEFKTQFFSAFNKNHTKYNIVSFINGNWAVYQANRKGLSNRFIADWAENIIRNKDVITSSKTGERTVNPKVKEIISNIRVEIKNSIDSWSKDNTIDSYADLADSLDKLGVNIDKKVLLYIGSLDNSLGNGKAHLNNFFNKGDANFNYILKKFEDLKNPFDAEGGLDAGESEAIKKAASMAVKASPELYESSFQNLSGKTVYAHLEQNFLSKFVSRLTSERYRDAIFNSEESSYFKDQLFYTVDEEGNKVLTNSILTDIQSNKSIFDIMVTEGLTDDKNNRTAYQNLDSTGQVFYTIHNYFNNGSKKEAWYKGPVLSDAPNGLVFKHTKSSKDDVLAKLVEIAGQEYNRITSIRNQIKKAKDSGLENNLIKNYHTKENSSVKTGYHIIQGMRGSKADLKSESNYNSVKDKIDKWLTPKTKEYFNSMVNSGVIVMKDGKISTDSRLDSRIVNKYNTEKALKEYIQEFYFNDFLARAEFNLLTVGDPAFYKSSKTGNNKTVDFTKRAKEIYSPKSLLDVESSFVDEETGEIISTGLDYKTIYLNDNEIQAPSFDNIKNAIDSNNSISEQKKAEILESYESGINQTDAQAYVTLPFYRKTMIGMGKWTQAHQQAYKRLEKSKGTGSDIALMMQPLKPFMYGQVYSDKFNRMIPIQNKNSEYLLLPQLANKSVQLKNLLNFMNGAKVDSVNFESAVKAGLSKTIKTELFNDKEAVDNFIKEEYLKDSTNWVHKLSMEDRGIQQEVPEHFVDSSNLFGTQIRKLIMSDLFDGTTYMGLSPDRLKNLYEDLITADLVEAYEELNKEIALNPNRKDGEDVKINYKYLYGLLLDEARKRGKGEEFEKAIEYDEANDRLTLPLFNPITARSAQNLITSIFKTRITKQKVKGGAFVQLSNFGFTEELKLIMNEDGGLDYAQVMLPAWSKKFFEDFMDDNGDVDFETIKEVAPEILDMVGYRIPTEDKYSMLPLRVVGFLPYGGGGAIMLPAEITKISGSDFDVDKMFVMMKAFRTKKRLDYNKVITELAERGYKASFNDVKGIYDKKRNDEELTERESELYTEIESFPKETLNKVKTVTGYEEFKYDDSKSAIENSKSARDNKKMDVMLSVLRNPHTLESILSGGTFEPLQNIAEETLKKIGKTNRELDPTSVTSMDYMHKDNMTGKSMVGIAANENAFHAIAQNANLKLKTSINFEGDKYVNLSGQNAAFYVYMNKETKEVKVTKNAGNKISKNKAYYLAAIVDNAKDPVASYINYNDYTSGIVGLLSQAGLDPATITWFLKQPIIDDITNKFFASGKDWSEESVIINEYKNKFRIKDDPTEAPNLNTEDLYKSLSDNIDDNTQIQVFKAFLVYKKLAKSWTSLVLSARSDTKGFGPTLADAESINKAVEEVLKPGFQISGASDLFNVNSKKTRMVASFHEYGIKKPLDIVNKMFPYSIGLYDRVKNDISGNLKGRDLSANERNKINDHVTAYMLSKYDFFNPNERSYLLNEFPKEFLDIKEKDITFADNYLIRRLQYRSNASDSKTPIERIEFNNTGKTTNEQKDDIQKAWLDLYSKEEYREIATKLLKYTYFTTGMSYSANGFAHLASVDFLSTNGVRDSKGITIAEFLNNMNEYDNVDNNEDARDFEDQFYRNNYSNTSYVPRVNDRNITKGLRDEAGAVIGFLIDGSKVKEDSLVPDKTWDVESGSYIYDDYTPFISYKQGDNTFIYRLTSQNNGEGVYVLDQKLGFNYHIYEYQRGASGLRSQLDINKVNKYSVSDVINLGNEVKKPVKDVVMPAKKSAKNKELGLFKINDAEMGNTNGYTLNFLYDNKNYNVSRSKNGKYINLKTNKELSKSNTKDSLIIKLFNKAVEIVQETTCGGK